MMGWRYKAGLFLISAVVIIWVSSAEVTQGIYNDYKQPFAVTYLGASLMVVYLPIAFIKDWLCNKLKSCSSKSRKNAEAMNESSGKLDFPLKQFGEEMIYGLELGATLAKKDSNIDLTSEEERPLFAEHKQDEDPKRQYKELTNREVIMCGFYIAPLWFVTEYLSNAALAQTSVASTTVLSSTSGLFTLLFGVLLGQDSFTMAKLVAVFVCMTGVIMTTLGKTWARDEPQLSASADSKHSLLGDIFGLLSAVSYGLFTVLLKKFAGEEGERVDECRKSSLGCRFTTHVGSGPSRQQKESRLPRPATNIDSKLPLVERCTRDALLEKLEISMKQHKVEEALEIFKDFKRIYGYPMPCIISRLIDEFSYSSDPSWLQKGYDLVLAIANERLGLLQRDLLTRFCLSLARAQMPVPASQILRLMLQNGNIHQVDVMCSVIMHMVKTEVGTCLASNILVELADFIHRVDAKKSNSPWKKESGTLIFNLVLNACVKYCFSLKGQEVIELMSRVGVVADAHSIVIFSCIYEMNGQRYELKRFKEYIDQVSVRLLPTYSRLYDKLLSLHYKFNDLDAAIDLVVDLYKCCKSRPFMMNKSLEKLFLVSLGSHHLKEGLNVLIMPELLQKDSVLIVEGKQELVVVKDGKLMLSGKGLAQLMTLYKQNRRIAEFPKLLISIHEELGKLGERLCSDIIDACIRIGWLETAHDILDDMAVTGKHLPSASYISLLAAYCGEKMYREAEALVTQIQKDSLALSISDQALVSEWLSERAYLHSLNKDSLMNAGESGLAMLLVREMNKDEPVPSTIYELNSSIYFFCKAKMTDDALKIYRKMQAMKFDPTIQTYAYLIQMYSSVGNYRQLTILWGDVKRNMEHVDSLASRDLFELLLLNFIRGGYFERVLEVISFMKHQDMYLDKWMYRREFLKLHKNLYRNLRAVDAKTEAQSQRLEHVKAFRKWVGID